MSDLIDRQEAIDFIDAGHLCNPNEPRWSDNEIVNFLKSRPSAQPERKTGRWIDDGQYGDNFPHHAWLCSECGEGVIEIDTPWFKFCPNCGAKMEVEHD